LRDFIAKKGFQRATISISAVGDRSDADILSVARGAASLANSVFLFEDPRYLRGRQPGEITKLLRQGFLESGVADENIHRLSEETDAIRGALQTAGADDLVLVMSADAEHAMEVVRTFSEKRTEETHSVKQPSKSAHRRKVN
jgi:UDP-N-acetylmuramyl tripeptide synthase